MNGKLFSALLMVCLLQTLPIEAGTSLLLPENTQQNVKETTPGKTARKMSREMQKQGWKSTNGLPIDVALQQHYDKLAAAGLEAVSVEGYAEATQLNTAIRMAQNNATIQYAQMMGTQVDGRALTEIMTLNTSEAKSASKFDATYITKVQQFVKALRSSMSFYYQKQDGTYVVRSFFIGKEMQ